MPEHRRDPDTSARVDAPSVDHDVRRLTEEQAALRRVAELVAQASAPTDVFATVANEASHLLDVPIISMVRFEPDGTATVIAASRGEPFSVGTNLVLDGPSVIASIRETGLSAAVSNYEGLTGRVAEGVRGAGVEAAFGSPIIVERKVWGALVAVAPIGRALAGDAEGRLAVFAQLVATAVSNAETLDAVRRLADEQTALRHVATLVAQGAGANELFTAVAVEVARVLDVPAIMLERYEADNSTTVLAANGLDGFPVGSRWPLDGPSLSARVRESGVPERVENYAGMKSSIASTALEAEITSAVAAPILVDGSVWGLMSVGTKQTSPLPSDTEDRLADFTALVATAISNAQTRDDLESLADEQAALRRVATLVARGTEASVVFEAVCEETARLIGATGVNLGRFTPDGFNLTVAGWSLRGNHVPPGTRLPLDPDSISGVIYEAREPARMDSYEGATGALATLVRKLGMRSSVGAPVVVDGRVWGALIAVTDRDEPLPPRTEYGVARFTELIATAISNAATRTELISSRARIVAVGDEARRRIERNLHDGVQQRLISLGLDLQVVAAALAPEQRDVREGLERVERELSSVLEEVRELSRGLHPALLSRMGLAASLRALARKSPIPVDLEVDLETRPAAQIEICTYYVISEALSNALRHSNASRVSVNVAEIAGAISISIVDDGVGGAKADDAGTGLIGLVDRVEALGGRLTLSSPEGVGTSISVDLPLARSEDERRQS